MSIRSFLLGTLTLLSLYSCCWSDDCPDEGEPFVLESEYEPVYLQRNLFEESVTLSAPRSIVNSGKIYAFNDLLFINEKNEGFHIYLNDDPANPTPINFLEAPGSTDVSIKNGIYYVNHAVDLIAITYNYSSTELIISKRIRNIFPVMRSPDGFYPIDANENNIAVNWILKNE